MTEPAIALPSAGPAAPPAEAPPLPGLTGPHSLPGPTPDRAPVADLLALEVSLQTQQSALIRLSVELEKRFLSLSEQLVELATRSGQMVERSGQLFALASKREDGGNLLQSIVNGVEEPLDFVERSGQRAESFLGKLKATLQSVRTLLRTEDTLQRTVKPLRFIRTLFQVESAALSTDVQQMFSGLTQEIDTLSFRVSQSFQEKFDLLRSSQFTIRGTHDRLEDQSITTRHYVHESKDRIGESLAKLRADLARNIDQSDSLVARGQKLHNDIGQAVVGLQFQDIVNQKMQHIRLAFGDAQAALERLAHEKDPARIAADARFLQRLAKIETAQLQAVAGDLARAAEEVGSGIRAIRDSTAHLDECCLALGSSSLVAAGEEGLVDVLIEVMKTLRALLEATVQGASQSYEAIHPVRGSASCLTTTVQEISYQIRLIALNAQVQATHISEGHGLEVLAARTADVAREVEGISEGAAVSLRQLSTTLDAVVADFEQWQAEGLQQQTKMKEQGGKQEQVLHGFRDQMLQTLLEFGEFADQIKTRVASSLVELNYSDLISTRTEECVRLLQEVAEKAEACLANDPELGKEAAAAAVAALAQRYTMDSERIAHDAALGVHPAAHADPAGGSPDLFGSNTPDGAALTSPDGRGNLPGLHLSPATGADAGANIEFF